MIVPTRNKLWFDVGLKRYTTIGNGDALTFKLWFDVGLKRYTTITEALKILLRCGLM